MAYSPMSQYRFVKCKWIRAEMQKGFRNPTRTKYDLQTTRGAYIGWLLARDGFEPMKYQHNRMGRWDLPGFSLAQPQLAVTPGGVQNYIMVTTAEGFEASALLPIHIFQDPSLYETCEESHEPEAPAVAVEAPLFADQAPAIVEAEESAAEPEAPAAEWVNMAPFGFPEFEAFPAATLPSGASLMRIRPVDCPLASVCWEVPGAAMASLGALLEMAGKLRAAYAETAAALHSGGMRQAPARAAIPSPSGASGGIPRRPVLDGEDIAYHRAWRPASGHAGGWRVIRYPDASARGAGRMETHSRSDGAPRLFKTFASASKRAQQLEAEARTMLDHSAAPPSGGMKQDSDQRAAMPDQLARDARPQRGDQRAPLWRDEIRQPVPGGMSGAGFPLWREERRRPPRLSGGMSAGLGPIWRDEARRARPGGMNAGVQPLWRDEASRSPPPSGGMKQGQDPPWRNERRRPLWRNEAQGPPVYSSWRNELRWSRSHSWRDEGRLASCSA